MAAMGRLAAPDLPPPEARGGTADCARYRGSGNIIAVLRPGEHGGRSSGTAGAAAAVRSTARKVMAALFVRERPPWRSLPQSPIGMRLPMITEQVPGGCLAAGAEAAESLRAASRELLVSGPQARAAPPPLLWLWHHSFHLRRAAAGCRILGGVPHTGRGRCWRDSPPLGCSRSFGELKSGTLQCASPLVQGRYIF